MGTRQFLIDTNAVIDYLAGRMPPTGTQFLSEIINTHPLLSVITKIEVLGFSKMEKEDQELIASFVGSATILGIPEMVVEQTIILRQAFSIKLPDAIIAATAMCYRLKLVTRNISDFKRIGGLAVVNPHDL